MAYYRILSLDGGGIRGLLTAILLDRLEQVHPGFLSQIDLFAGTSTGGVLALGFAAGRTPREAIQLYERYGSKVFSDSFEDDLRDLGHFVGAEYSLEPLKEILQSQFGELTLGELEKKVLISSFDLDNTPRKPGTPRSWKAKFFHNYPGPDSDGGEKLVDVALRTSAAPTFFPIYQGYIDGGVVAGNPSLCALAQAIHPETGGQKLEDVLLLSVGTGENPRYLEAQDEDWGLVQWAPVLVDLMLEGSSGLANYQCRQLLGEHYLRLNPKLPNAIGMDRVCKIPELWEVASRYRLNVALIWLREYFPL
jgi:patatin-like phospholipase/acyl hydrolase